MSQGKDHWQDSKIRGDEIMWVNNRWQLQESHPNIYNLLLKLDLLRQELNNSCKFKSEQTQVLFFTHTMSNLCWPF